ncbi:hypothetical protein [Streptomyces sp. NBC_01481]|uniref:hypothetical protein n=1 Tax=Streptomyces sp. NBC_01481 TaxID=2975869 RepID=UPI0022535B70|nr:hypothetical protein [Streptomyces sp. NBC_01481]MCX4587794.1 hypothetical protein [Streptomyces sp. NBC_01481]
MSAVSQLRLLPWPGPEGQRCYLSSDDPESRLNRLANELEATQLDTGAMVLGRARELLVDPDATAQELRWLSLQLCQSLGDTLRVAESRGGRLRLSEDGRIASGTAEGPER